MFWNPKFENIGIGIWNVYAIYVYFKDIKQHFITRVLHNLRPEFDKHKYWSSYSNKNLGNWNKQKKSYNEQTYKLGRYYSSKQCTQKNKSASLTTLSFVQF